MGNCDALANDDLDLHFGATAYSVPGTLYLGLCTGVASDGTITGEPTGNNYSRATITNDTSSWEDAAARVKANKIDFEMPVPSATWGSLDTWFLSTSASGGVALIYGLLDEAKEPVAGVTPRFVAGALTITQADGDSA